ncbi:MAG: 4-hydroxy-3-methylbut-2-enyl diphosphate reductase [Dehalococcoidia bacterium]|nr:4-hydroxy-3-methylbut-2-enyl diphosphate reductase [Dehalococcoidia bacterium]
MEIERARELGLCFGVRRAVNMLRDASRTYGALQTLGPLAHNRVLLGELEALGVSTVDSAEQLTGPIVVISAHGVSPLVEEQLRDRGFTIIDTTCPNVARAQHIASDMAREGLTIVIFGDAGHTEVRGLLGWAGNGALATLDARSQSGKRTLSRTQGVGIISQTTQRLEDFTAFAQHITAGVLPFTHEVRVVNTLCDATRRRQQAAAELARTVDTMIVIGGRTSANTRRLTETCEAIVETYHVESADELQTDLLRRKRRIGLTAGASTPDSSIDEVENRLRGL